MVQGFNMGQNLTPHHAKYFAYDLTRCAPSGLDRLSMSLFDASVDLNPHQIEAALFALQSPLSKGVVLADEVGLGKTIEAGIVLCQYWAERKRRLLVVCPASLRKQWALELSEKFNLPTLVLDAKSHRAQLQSGRNPLDDVGVLIISFNYANALRTSIQAKGWDLVVIDEAHKLRNAYRPSNILGQGIRWATQDCRKLLLTATPLQNSLLELYGLSTLIDEHLFGDLNSFRSQYTGLDSNVAGLRSRLSGFCRRTLRKQVMEYIRYTERHAITRPFKPSDDEDALYCAVSEFLQREDSYSLPERQRHLTTLILRKLLASSSQAVAATLNKLKVRLERFDVDLFAKANNLLEANSEPSDEERSDEETAFAQSLIESEELDDDLLDEVLSSPEPSTGAQRRIDKAKLRDEIAVLQKLADWAGNIGVDTKTTALLAALEVGFARMAATGAARKALIFTESRRTQDYLKQYLESNGYTGKIVLFNGTNASSDTGELYKIWRERNRETGRATGSRALDVRTALIDAFRDDGEIMIATEAASEGINLQFCSLVVNYDLPWNPQRIEQRIGRCHRYGQQHDVVVINFLNERNEADRRVLELLGEKFNLFNGVFGASDEVLGSIESGVDFSQRIFAIYQQCRTPQEIDAAFRALQAEMDESIRTRLLDTRRTLFEHFDEDVHERLRLQLDDTKASLDRVARRFWALTRYMLHANAHFDEQQLSFELARPPGPEFATGRYHLISKSKPQHDDTSGNATPHAHLFAVANKSTGQLYRLSHPLGEHVLSHAKALATPSVRIEFDSTHHPTHIHVVEALRGKQGFLSLTRVCVESYETEEYLLFSGFDDAGTSLEHETIAKLFLCAAQFSGDFKFAHADTQRLHAEAQQHIKGTLSQSLEANSVHFHQAREKLEQWADDQVLSSEKALLDTKEQIKILRRSSRQAQTLQAAHEVQQQLQKLEKLQSQQRREIFNVEDQIRDRRDALVEALERRLTQSSQVETLFSIRWAVI